MLSVRFEVGVNLLLAPAGADKRGPKAPFPLVGYAGIRLAIRKRVPAGAPAEPGLTETTAPHSKSFHHLCSSVTGLSKFVYFSRFHLSEVAVTPSFQNPETCL